MKSSYRVRVGRRPNNLRHRLQPGSIAALEQIIEGATLREATAADDGSLVVELFLDRPSHETALNEIAVALQQLGYAWLEASITEWVDDIIGGAIVGCLGGGAAGANGDKLTALLSAAIGALIGAMVGSTINNTKVVYTVHWTEAGWEWRPAAPTQTVFSRPLQRSDARYLLGDPASGRASAQRTRRRAPPAHGALKSFSPRSVDVELELRVDHV